MNGDFRPALLPTVRLDEDGNVMAIAAGGLKYFKAGDFEIDLNERIDLALWKTDGGKFQGVIQGHEGEIPRQLLTITKDWIHLSVPVPER